MAVSPFDGANRIRFKGSLGFLVADFTPRLSAATAAPPKAVLSNKQILRPGRLLTQTLLGKTRLPVTTGEEVAPLETWEILSRRK